MALSQEDRDIVAQKFMQDGKCPGSVVKPQLRTGVGAADDWIDIELVPGTATTYVSYMAANAAAFWTAANATQKSEILVYCLDKRYGRL